jgi:hypothetical protein
LPNNLYGTGELVVQAKRGNKSMKIIKEVVIAAAMDNVWSWLNANSKVFNLSSGRDGEPESQRVSEAEQNVTLINCISPNRLVISTIEGQAVTTSVDLIEKGRHVGLKVTISGWENVDPEQARLEMPRVSLDWEKKLGLIKKAIESSHDSL